MICFHGSDVIIDTPKIFDTKRPLDFGGGFYTTTSETQAKNWAIKVSYRNNTKQKYINKYEFDLEEAKKNLSILIFEKADEKWLDFICANRNRKPVDNYDIIIGPVADDKVYRVVVEYENGDVDRETALKRLKTEKLYDQILFHTEESLKFLKFIGVEES
jgi:hypothetical protein